MAETKESTGRKRHVNVLKATIEKADKLTNNADMSSVIIFRDELETTWANYGAAFELHENTLIGRDEPTLGSITQEFSAMHNAYLSTKLHLGKLAVANSIGGSLNSTMFDGTMATATKTFKMPPIKITVFSGEITEWTEFKATCRSVLTDKINDVHRLQYWKDALKGEPRELVSHILPADGAYERAMKLLVDRYENTRTIVNHHLRRLYLIPRDENSVESKHTLRTIINIINGLRAALIGVQIETESWDAILIFNTSQCLHPISLKAWEERLEGTRKIPALATYVNFLETRITILENTVAFPVVMAPHKSPPKAFNIPKRDNKGDKDQIKTLYTLKADFQCLICKKNHLSQRCDALNNMPVQKRRITVRDSGACFNCLQSYVVANCPFMPTCKKCDGNHHTMLHEEKQAVMLNQVDETNDTESLKNGAIEKVSMIAAEHFFHIEINSKTVLATALVPVLWNGRSMVLRALIDQGSTANLITDRACQALQLPRIPTQIPMTGVGDAPVGNVVAITSFSFSSVHVPSYQQTVNSIVVKPITTTHEIEATLVNEWQHIKGLQLADPQFFEANKIDLLLGSAVYGQIIHSNIKKGESDEPIAQKTDLGWIIFGAACANDIIKPKLHAINHMLPEDPLTNLTAQLQRFWQIEEAEPTKFLTPDEQAAEDLFTASVTRDTDEKFVLDLPFKVDPNSNCLGESRSMAEKRLLASQRRFNKNQHIRQMYSDNLMEYLTLGHMEKLQSNEIPRYFLPHHPVVKESSTTTKVRTVFDASAKTSNGMSLNDILYVGPTIQPELFDQLIRWRRGRYALSGDIEKMYRQIKINPEHALFQCILVIDPETNHIETYKLTTVTFGTASAPFQAIRAIDEIGRRIETSNPKLSANIRTKFYVDDFLGCADSVEEACQMREQITEELAKYGFNLRKWKANDEKILANVEASEREELVNFDSAFKTLGLMWQPHSDNFLFKSCPPKQVESWTKRSILSEIAKLFDPLGLLSPCVAQAKMLMQDIWRLPNTISWDATLPQHIVNKWLQIYNELCMPIPMSIPRWIGLTDESVNVQLHTFCDASTLCFAGVVYVRIEYPNGQVECRLVTSKTKLAPIKTISVPRLELCGAVLATKLLRRCVDTLALNHVDLYAWCDSKIVLAWLASCPSKWNTFVANRISYIQQTLPTLKWQHVATNENSADIASRGASVSELASSKIWWTGPTFINELRVNIEVDTQCDANEENLPERKKAVQVFIVNEPEQNYVLNNFALTTYTRLLRFTVLAIRWRNKTRNRYATITAQEIVSAERRWVKSTQKEAFGHDIKEIRQHSTCRNQLLRPLNPFVDEHGVLRMHGRVGNADMANQTTAIILPAKHILTNLIIRDAHGFVMHGGVQMTLRKLREKFWIIHARRQVQKAIHDCLLCFRYRLRPLQQQMGALPLFRTEQARPFAFVGCDYTGHFEIKLTNRRNSPVTKGYIALFICLTTKAIHLELATDMTTAEFIMAFENFIARRGIPMVLYSDNGTNFIGAAKEINVLFEQMVSQNNAFTRLLASNRIQFKTLPPRASHMAGIWERHIASVKYHLRRVLGDTKLTARRFDYVLKQIEACLNSRPLWAVSPDGDDIEVITPSHFFNFQAINNLPRPDLEHVPMNRLDQYQYLYRTYCDFWKGWSNEYLHQLQPRTKWHAKRPNLQVGNIVLVAEDNVPPSRWVAGRIVKTHPGSDGLVRVAEVRLANGAVVKRSIHKLGLLPLPENELLEQSVQRGENVSERIH